MREPVTRKEIDAEISKVQRTIEDLKAVNEDPLLIGMFCADLNNLLQIQETMLCPWEKVRPTNEQTLQSFGVV